MNVMDDVFNLDLSWADSLFGEAVSDTLISEYLRYKGAVCKKKYYLHINTFFEDLFKPKNVKPLSYRETLHWLKRILCRPDNRFYTVARYESGVFNSLSLDLSNLDEVLQTLGSSALVLETEDRVFRFTEAA